MRPRPPGGCRASALAASSGASRRALRPPVDIGLDQDGALLVGTAQLLEQNEQVLVAQRGQGPARELALEDTPLHMAAVVIERHFECVGAHLRPLARRLVGGTERSPYPEPRPRLHAEQREAEEGERDGKRERTARDEEEGEEQERHAGALPQTRAQASADWPLRADARQRRG